MKRRENETPKPRARRAKRGRYARSSAFILQMATAMLLLAACVSSPFAPVVDDTAPPLSGAATAEDGWQSGAPMPTARSEMRVAVVENIFYVPGGFGGLTKFEAYDPANDRWTALAPLPQPAHHMMATGHNGKVFVFGGARYGLAGDSIDLCLRPDG